MNYERFISMLPSAHDESSYRNLLKIAKILNRELLIEDKKAFSAIFRLIDLTANGALSQESINDIYNYIKQY